MPASFLKRYSFENFINELDAYMKANLGAYIDQMNVDKTDLVLTKPVDAAFYFQSLTGSEVPYSIFLFYGEIGTSTKSNGPEQRKQFTLQVAIILANTNELQHVMGKRLLRYRECLEAMFNQGWNTINKRIKLEVSGISPFPFSLVNTDATHVGVGVTLELEIG